MGVARQWAWPPALPVGGGPARPAVIARRGGGQVRLRGCRVSAAGARGGREVRARSPGCALGTGRILGWLPRPLPRARVCAAPLPLPCPRHCCLAAPGLRAPLPLTARLPRGARCHRAAPRGARPLAALRSPSFSSEPRPEEPSLRRGGAECRGVAGFLNRSAFSQSPERRVVAEGCRCRRQRGEVWHTWWSSSKAELQGAVSPGAVGRVGRPVGAAASFPSASRSGPSCVRDGAGRAAG